ncbi:MAG TPA: flagellin [Gemmataceae bacterium]|nr:flagellin [Gemmataceae bacterium]
MLSLINNLPALTAESNLNSSNDALNTSLQRLSSGLQINSGADNPAGLVISQIQQAQMSGLQSAITNTSNATNVAQTADGGLNEINSLLVQIRGLAVSAANSGATDPDMLAADQSQITNALQTITSIATSTQYGQDQLLNGSHAVTASVQQLPSATVTLGTGTATGTYTATAAGGTANGNYSADITQAAAQASATGSAGGGTAAAAGIAANTEETLTINGASNVQIQLNGGASGLTGTQVEGLINQYTNQTGVTASLTTGTTPQLVLTANNDGTAGNNYTVTETGGTGLGFSSTPTSLTGGANIEGTITDPNGNVYTGVGNGNALTADGVTITAGSDATAGTIETVAVAGGNQGNQSTAAATVNTASGTYTASITQLATQATLEGTTDLTGQQVVGANETDTLTINGVQIQLNGGAAGMNADGAVAAINQYTNQTGVTASVNTTGGEFLELTSVGYGSAQNIQVEESGVSNPSNPNATIVGVGTGGLSSATLTDGKDVAGTVTSQDSSGNTITYATTGEGNVLTAANGLAITTNPGGTASSGTPETLTTVVNNNALLFQIGANAGQNASLAIQSVQADAIGTGVTNSSGIVSLSQIDVTNSNQSFSDILNVIDQAINQVSTLSGNLGAFQDNTLQATAANLQSSLQNTTAANSTIRDTDFASESANYAQDQVLVQAGTEVLKDANQLPQLVLTLLQ